MRYLYIFELMVPEEGTLCRILIKLLKLEICLCSVHFSSLKLLKGHLYQSESESDVAPDGFIENPI